MNDTLYRRAIVRRIWRDQRLIKMAWNHMNTLNWARDQLMRLQDAGIAEIRDSTTSFASDFEEQSLLDLPDPILSLRNMANEAASGQDGPSVTASRMSSEAVRQGPVFTAIYICSAMQPIMGSFQTLFKDFETALLALSRRLPEAIGHVGFLTEKPDLNTRAGETTVGFSRNHLKMEPLDKVVQRLATMKSKKSIDREAARITDPGLLPAIIKLRDALESFLSVLTWLTDHIRATSKHFGMDKHDEIKQQATIRKAWGELIGAVHVENTIEPTSIRLLLVCWWEACEKIIEVEEIIQAVVAEINDDK